METVKLFLAGDVMTGRGIDQILPYPGDPALFEDHARSAAQYVTLAERACGKIPAPVDFGYIWGDALAELDRQRPGARIVNLETAVTACKTPEPKGINYKMNPANVPVLSAAGLDCCVLANNHVLDWGRSGLLDTLAALRSASMRTAGAGETLDEAFNPAIVETGSGHRICVYGFGSETSGIPRHWAALENRPGICLFPDLSGATARRVAGKICARKRDGDITIISIHWGSNWGYQIPKEQQSFARTLIDLGACDILHAHSSHHACAAEIYRGKLILYGCGDFINDYEGISGPEDYRGDLSVMYLPRIDATSAAMEALTLVVFQMHQLRLRRASLHDVTWLQTVLNRESQPFGTRFLLAENGALQAEWE